MAKNKFALIFIFLLALFLRFYRLAEYPVGFHIDEASLGYNAYSLLKTGRDENGQAWPLHIDMFGDYRPAGYQYLSIIPVYLFGLTEFATRFMSALFGSLTVLLIYYFVNELLALTSLRGSYFATLPESLGLLAAFLLSISPWHVVISRASAETIVALFFVIWGATYFLRVLQGKNGAWWRAVLCWLASLFFYHSSRVFVPALSLGWLLVVGRRFSQAGRVWLLVTLAALALVFGAKGGTGRFKQVSIFHFPEIRLVLAEQIREDGVAGVPVLVARFFHNKLINYTVGYLREYFRYFSLNFLFIDGGLPAWYVVPQMGLVYLVHLPFFFIGLYQLTKQGHKNRFFWLPLVWLVLGPTVAGLTRDDVPNVQRSLVMLPAILLIISFGISRSWVWLQKQKAVLKNFALLVYIFLVVANAAYFLHQYFVHTQLHRPWYRFNGFKQMVLAVAARQGEYDKILVTKSQGGVYMHFLFFQKFSPADYQALGSPRDRDYGGFGKLVFVPEECPQPEDLATGQKTLIVAAGHCPGGQGIQREDGTLVFKLISATSK